MGTVTNHILKLHFPVPSLPASLGKADFSRTEDIQLNHREPCANMVKSGTWYSSPQESEGKFLEG